MGKILKVALRVYSAILILLRIALVFIVIVAIFSFAVQQVSLESIGTPFVEVRGTNVVINVPVTIRNYGFYSINDIFVKYTIQNKTVELVNGTHKIGNIETNSIDTFDVPIVVNLEKIYKMEYPELYHFTHRDTLNANITLSLKYMFNWVNISVTLDHEFQWIPPIEDVEVYNINNVQMNTSGDMYFNIPYLLKTANYLSGTARIEGKIKSVGGTIGEFSSSADLGMAYKGNVHTVMYSSYVKSLITKSQNLQMIGNISLYGFDIPFNYEYYWGAPLANLSYSIVSNQVLHYSFTDEALFPLSLKITKIFYYQGSEVKSETSYLDVSPGEHVSKYENLNITQPIDEVKIIFYDRNTGITYEEVLSL